MNFSLEIGPKTDLDTLPNLKDIYISFLPGGDFKEVMHKIKENNPHTELGEKLDRH